MITKYKIYENEHQTTSLVINDLIDYYINDNVVKASAIYEFVEELLKFNRVVEFQCLRCTELIDGVTNSVYMGKKHKGKVRGFAYGLNVVHTENISLKLELSRIKYSHEVDTNKPMIIYGEIETHLKDVIEDINVKNNVEKYNL